MRQKETVLKFQPERSLGMRHQSQDNIELRHLLGWFSEWKFWVWLAGRPPEEGGRTRESIKLPLTRWRLSIKSKNEIKLNLQGLVLYATMLHGVSFNLIE